MGWSPYAVTPAAWSVVMDRAWPKEWKPLGLLLMAAASAAAPSPAAAQSQTQNAKASVKVVKPLVLTWEQDLNLGTILLGPGTYSGAIVSLTRGGTFSCTNPNLTCSGAVQTARYRVAGTNNQTVRISAPNVTMTNQSDPTKTLTLVVDSPGTLTLPNSGSQGVPFTLGGSISLSSTTADGTYVGTFNVTVDY